MESFKVAVINLDKRTDRLEKVIPEITNFGLTFDRISPIEHKEPYKSHGLTYVKLLKEGYNFIFEDDVYFCDGAKKQFDEAFEQLPSDFDLFYLTANLRRPLVRYSKNLFRCQFAWGAIAIYYSQKGIEYILKNYNPLSDEKDLYGFPNCALDNWLKKQTIDNLKAYIISPIICWTHEGYSDTMKHIVDYRKMMQDGEKKYMQ